MKNDDFLNRKFCQKIQLRHICFKCLDGAAPIEKTNNAQTLIPGIKAPAGGNNLTYITFLGLGRCGKEIKD